MSKRMLLPFSAALLIGVYFIALAKDAILSYFSPDDCFTIYHSLEYSAGALLKANLLFFRVPPFFRPMGSVWSRTIFDLAGFNPVPYHIAHLLTLAVNIWFTYCVARRLTASKTVGVLAALLISFHGRFISLYFDTGYIYDVVCYFFYFAALAFYLRVRSRPRPPKGWELMVLSVLYICALNTKEMAVTLPVFLLAYEWLYHRDLMGGPRNLWKWSTTYGLGVLLVGVFTLAFVFGRTTHGLMTKNAFQPVFTWSRFVETSVNFVSPLLFRDDLLPFWLILLVWLVLLAIACAAKSRALMFAWLFLMLSVLPVAFIDPRGPGQYYITYFGWVLYAAIILVEGTRRAARRFTWASGPLLIACVAAAMFWVNRSYTWSDVSTVAVEGEQLRAIVDQIHRLRPTLPHGSRVLFLNDPMDEPWRIMYLMRLSYRDLDMVVDRVRFMNPPPTPSEIAAYDCVFDYSRGRFYSSAQMPARDSKPEIIYDYQLPAVFHADWKPVTHGRPAKAGERVITEIENLGDTDPPVRNGQPFPTEPFAQVTSAIEVRVDGQPVEVITKIGWPKRVNRYRVDFRIPQNIRPGEPQVVIVRGDTAGPPTPIQVR